MADNAPGADVVRLTIDGRELQVPKGTLVIRAAEQLGITIPRFCDHPLLEPLGACRQCIVEVEGQRKPFTACTTTVMPDMVVKTHLTSEVAREAQEQVLEFLLLNHPLDCPQCDKGGECPLQDQTLAHGPAESRMLDEKRRYPKALPISPLVVLDRERCVLCARCTRFSQEISGDPFIELFERGALEQVAIYEDEPYHSYYSGNVVQICPVGALTSTTYRFKSRPFDLRSHPGVCNHCANGCNLRVDVRRGEVVRQLARENMAVNEDWTCDKGRYAHTWIRDEARVLAPHVRDEVSGLVQVAWLRALQEAASRLQAALDAGGPAAVGVLTGGRLVDEDAYAVSRFARDALGTDNVDFRLRPRSEEVPVLAAIAGSQGPTYDDVEAASVVVVVGLDPEEEAPILHLRLRKAHRRGRQTVVVVGPSLGSLADLDAPGRFFWLATGPGGEADVLDDLAHGRASQLPGGEEVVQLLGTGGAVILVGERAALSPSALPAAAELAEAGDLRFAWVPRRAGARGAVDAGLLPGVLPGGRSLADPGPVAATWSRVPADAGLDARGMLEAAARGELQALVLVGVDPITDFEDAALATEALRKVPSLIVLDLLATASTRHADVLLPACGPQERVGSFTTWEGRRQPFPQAVPAAGVTQPDWDIVRQLALLLGRDLGWETANDVRGEAAPLMDVGGAPLARLRPIERGAPAAAGEGDLDAVVVDPLFGPGSTMLGRADALLATARAPVVRVHPDDAARLGLTDGATVAVTGAADARAVLPVAVTDRVTPGVVVVPGPASGVVVPLGRVRLAAADRVEA